MMRSTLRGSAARALSARAIAPVSRCERYSTPAAERYWTDWPPAGAGAATEAAPRGGMRLPRRHNGARPNRWGNFGATGGGPRAPPRPPGAVGGGTRYVAA